MFPLLPEHSEKKKLKDNKSFFFRACFHYTFTLANHIIIIKLSRCCKKGCFRNGWNVSNMSENTVCLLRRARRLLFFSFLFTLYIQGTESSICSNIQRKNETQALQYVFCSLKKQICQHFYFGIMHSRSCFKKYNL